MGPEGRYFLLVTPKALVAWLQFLVKPLEFFSPGVYVHPCDRTQRVMSPTAEGTACPGRRVRLPFRLCLGWEGIFKRGGASVRYRTETRTTHPSPLWEAARQREGRGGGWGSSVRARCHPLTPPWLPKGKVGSLL